MLSHADDTEFDLTVAVNPGQTPSIPVNPVPSQSIPVNAVQSPSIAFSARLPFNPVQSLSFPVKRSSQTIRRAVLFFCLTQPCGDVTHRQKRTRERTNQICASVCASRGAHPALLQTKTDKASCTAPVRASLCPKLQTLQTTVSREHSGNCDVGSTQLRDGVLTNEGLRQRIPAASRLESTSRVSPRIRTLIVLSDSGGACAATSSSQGQVHLPATSAPP